MDPWNDCQQYYTEVQRRANLMRIRYREDAFSNVYDMSKDDWKKSMATHPWYEALNFVYGFDADRVNQAMNDDYEIEMSQNMDAMIERALEAVRSIVQ